jgi:hypothetical protein
MPGTRHEKVGDRFVFDFKPAGAKHWSCNAFDPRGNIHVTVNISGDNQHMTTAGCAMGGLICKRMSWTRRKVFSNPPTFFARGTCSSPAPPTALGRGLPPPARVHPANQVANNRIPATTIVAIETK